MSKRSQACVRLKIIGFHLTTSNRKIKVRLTVVVRLETGQF